MGFPPGGGQPTPGHGGLHEAKSEKLSQAAARHEEVSTLDAHLNLSHTGHALHLFSPEPWNRDGRSWRG
jgi:hypothetical protein